MATIAMKHKYIVKELVGATKLGESYVILDPQNSITLGSIDEEAGMVQSIARAFLDKAFLSAKLTMRDPQGAPVLDISRPAALTKSVFTVRGADGKVLCLLKQRFSMLSPGIVVEDGNGQQLGVINGGWRFRNFQFKDNNGNPVATIRHKSEGFLKELLTSADTYEVDIHADTSMNLISLAATVCIDFIYHED
ncbi:MAG: LURP-one-related family protein [Candidatus Riflebacteria bacterium]|nr:LURP-one-related family protein [Candidatus Riflebacteria bacterium]